MEGEVLTNTCNRLLPAVANFRIRLSHNGLVAYEAWLPVVRSGQKLLM
jgi:hypothetical protein